MRVITAMSILVLDGILCFLCGAMVQKHQCREHPLECRPTVIEHMDREAQLKAEQAAALVELKRICDTPVATATAARGVP